MLPGSHRRRAQQEEGRARGRSREADQLAGLTRRQADVRAQDEADRCVSGSREVPPRGGLAEARRRRWISGRRRRILRRRVRDVLKTRGAEKEGEPDYWKSGVGAAIHIAVVGG